MWRGELAFRNWQLESRWYISFSRWITSWEGDTSPSSLVEFMSPTSHLSFPSKMQGGSSTWSSKVVLLSKDIVCLHHVRDWRNSQILINMSRQNRCLGEGSISVYLTRNPHSYFSSSLLFSCPSPLHIYLPPLSHTHQQRRTQSPKTTETHIPNTSYVTGIRLSKLLLNIPHTSFYTDFRRTRTCIKRRSLVRANECELVILTDLLCWFAMRTKIAEVLYTLVTGWWVCSYGMYE